MLNYKQIWHGINPIRWLNKFNLTETAKDAWTILQTTYEGTKAVKDLKV